MGEYKTRRGEGAGGGVLAGGMGGGVVININSNFISLTRCRTYDIKHGNGTGPPKVNCPLPSNPFLRSRYQ